MSGRLINDGKHASTWNTYKYNNKYITLDTKQRPKAHIVVLYKLWAIGRFWQYNYINIYIILLLEIHPMKLLNSDTMSQCSSRFFASLFILRNENCKLWFGIELRFIINYPSDSTPRYSRQLTPFKTSAAFAAAVNSFRAVWYCPICAERERESSVTICCCALQRDAAS